MMFPGHFYFRFVMLAPAVVKTDRCHFETVEHFEIWLLKGPICISLDHQIYMYNMRTAQNFTCLIAAKLQKYFK